MLTHDQMISLQERVELHLNATLNLIDKLTVLKNQLAGYQEDIERVWVGRLERNTTHGEENFVESINERLAAFDFELYQEPTPIEFGI